MNPDEYKKYIISKISKVLNDELTAAVLYFKMANELQGISSGTVSKILKEHGDEEFGHFKNILEFAINHNIVPILGVDTVAINKNPTDLIEVIMLTQNLEKTAMSDYKEIVTNAIAQGDVETQEFFEDILEDEIHHFDELAPLVSQKRELGESKSFRGLLLK